jgi:[acyl-carrier-protein] S-malonyltransferase
LRARGLRPAAAAGHSLGEYAAHVAAGTLDLAAALRAVSARGRFMQQAVPVGQGAMAAILGLALAEVRRICLEVAGEDVVAPANLNAPEQVVVSGHAPAVERAVTAARAAGARRAVMLSVSAPFHCSLMQPAADRLRGVLGDVEFRDPAFPVYTNVDAAPVATGAEAREALLRQVTAPVRWHELIERLLDEGIEGFVEVGPGKVLAGLVRSIRHPAGVEAAAAELGRTVAGERGA